MYTKTFAALTLVGLAAAASGPQVVPDKTTKILFDNWTISAETGSKSFSYTYQFADLFSEKIGSGSGDSTSPDDDKYTFVGPTGQGNYYLGGNPSYQGSLAVEVQDFPEAYNPVYSSDTFLVKFKAVYRSFCFPTQDHFYGEHNITAPAKGSIPLLSDPFYLTLDWVSTDTDGPRCA